MYVKGYKKIITCLAIIIFALLVVANTFTVIPSGFTGVRTTFGQIDDVAVQNGFTVKVPFVQSVKKVNNKQQEVNFKQQVWGESSERTAVYMADITVTYRIHPEYSAWLYKNVNDYQQNALPQTLVASALKSSMVQLRSDEVTNRAKIEPLAIENTQAAIDRKYDGVQVMSIVNVSINDMNFEDSYNQAIAEKQVAQMEYEQQQIKNQTALEAANAAAEQKKIAVQAEAEQKKVAAEAEAASITAIAEAQAEANLKLAGSITEILVKYEQINKWDGKLPTVSGGDSLIGFDLPKEVTE